MPGTKRSAFELAKAEADKMRRSYKRLLSLWPKLVNVGETEQVMRLIDGYRVAFASSLRPKASFLDLSPDQVIVEYGEPTTADGVEPGE